MCSTRCSQSRSKASLGASIEDGPETVSVPPCECSREPARGAFLSVTFGVARALRQPALPRAPPREPQGPCGRRRRTVHRTTTSRAPPSKRARRSLQTPSTAWAGGRLRTCAARSSACSRRANSKKQKQLWEPDRDHYCPSWLIIPPRGGQRAIVARRNRLATAGSMSRRPRLARRRVTPSREQRGPAQRSKRAWDPAWLAPPAKTCALQL